MKRLTTLAAVGAAAAFAAFSATSAHAAKISFADYSVGNEGGIVNGSAINFGGTNIDFFSGTGAANSGIFSTVEFNPYFDDISGGKPAGLGVCRALDGMAGNGAPGAECRDAGDDSIDGDFGLNEMIVLIFDDPFDFRDISFRDGEHNLINDSMGLVSWGAYTTAGFIGGVDTFADFVALVMMGGLQGVNELGLSYNNTEFYIESISDVPIPAALPLLLSGVAGLGFASRKKKKA